jgi:hypothetical protein
MKDKSIGGFIELAVYKKSKVYHPSAIALANGRSCFHLFLKTYKPKKVCLPFYTCNTLLEPLSVTKTPFEFYKIDTNLEPLFDKELKKGEYLLAINYLGIKNKTMLSLEKKYGSKLIIDNTQDFYNKEYKQAMSFNSCRKFFGVPDGGYIYLKKKITQKFPQNNHFIVDHLVSRFLGKTAVYYRQFKQNESEQTNKVMCMSTLTESLLQQTDYSFIKKQRIENFKYLHRYLSKYNQFNVDIGTIGVPYAYPFMPQKHIDRTRFYNKRIFISTLWEDVLNRKDKNFKTEKNLSHNLLPLPIDQRYDAKEMQILINTLKPYL